MTNLNIYIYKKIGQKITSFPSTFILILAPNNNRFLKSIKWIKLHLLLQLFSNWNKVNYQSFKQIPHCNLRGWFMGDGWVEVAAKAGQGSWVTRLVIGPRWQRDGFSWWLAVPRERVPFWFGACLAKVDLGWDRGSGRCNRARKGSMVDGGL